MRSFNPIALVCIIFMFCGCHDDLITLQSDTFSVSLNQKGAFTAFTDPETQVNYIASGVQAPLLSLGIKGQTIEPEELIHHQDSTVIELVFTEGNIRARIQYALKKTHLTFELLSLEPKNQVDYIVWGPYPTTIDKTIGETVGVVRNDDYAIGIQALNIKTLGGFPTNDDDTEPAYDIFASSSLVDVADSVKVLYRGQTAKPTEYGSQLQAYTRERKDTVISVWQHDYYSVPAYDDGGVLHSKIALFGCRADQALETIGKIEVAEGLPHPEINGEWLKKAPKATASYLILSFGEGNIDKAIDLTKQAGLEYLYHGGPFESWGHFKLDPSSFPDNWESMRKCVLKAERQGVQLGVHTLSNFITTNDPYVSPKPDHRLAKVGASALAEPVQAIDTSIPIEDPTYFAQMENNNLHACLIGNEIIRYERVSERKPWKLLNCERGAFGTQASAHAKGESIAKLMDHGYKTFLGNKELSEEMAVRLAEFYNMTGLKQISFDGLEGNWASGMGQYGRQLFVQTWYDNLKPELKGKVINDASNPGHYFWHIFTRMNWGEPWYAGFRESQTQYRLMNQDYFHRNLLPHMLGWFQLSTETSLMDVEWLLARAAGFNAGFALASSIENIENHGLSHLILNKIRQWEKVRLAGGFSPEQREKLKDISNEFTLNSVGQNQWELLPIYAALFQHTIQKKQPGEPTYSAFDFENPYQEETLLFSVYLPENLGVSGITLEIDNYTTLELPVAVAPDHILSYEGGDQIMIYDQHWHIVNQVAIDASKLKMTQGHHEIKFEVENQGEQAGTIKVELKVRGAPEKISLPPDEMI